MAIIINARKPARVFALCCGIVYAWLNAAATVHSADRRDASFPISLRSDRQPSVSNIYIKCSYSPYAIPVSEFQTWAPDSSERAFFQTLTAVNKGDLDECKRLTIMEPTAGFKDLASVIEAYRTSFDLRPEHLQILGRLDLGTSILFLWETEPFGGITPPNLKARNLFSFEHINSGGFCWADSRNNPLVTLIRSSLQMTASQTNFERVISVKKTRFEYLIPTTTNGVAAALQFNGRVWGVALKSDKVDPKDEILNFYRQAFQTFEEGNMDTFAQYYTPESRKKFLGWFVTKSPDEVSAFKQDTLEARRFVSFIIDAPPFLLCSPDQAWI